MSTKLDSRAQTPTVGDAVARYLRTRAQRGELAATTVRSQRTTLRAFSQAVGPDRPIGTITRKVALRWWDAQVCSPSTARTRLAVVRTFLWWAVEQGHLKQHPLRQVRPPREPRRLPRTISREDVAVLLDHLPDRRAVAMALLMVQAGLRCGEVAALRVEHVDQRSRLMLVHGKGGHQRVLPIPDEAWAALQGYLAEHPAGSGPLFRRYDQPHLPLAAASVINMFTEWMQAAGVKQRRHDGVSAHALRRTCATDMLDGGANVRQVQAALGHARLATTEVYLRALDAADLRQAMAGRTYRASAVVLSAVSVLPWWGVSVA